MWFGGRWRGVGGIRIGMSKMIANPTLPTYPKILERVKAQEWTHNFIADNKYLNGCSYCGAPFYWEDQFDPCHTRIARAIQAAMVGVLRCAAGQSVVPGFDRDGAQDLREAADALEKGD